MGVNIEKSVDENLDKIKIGACLEFNFLCDNILNDIEKLNLFFNSNSFLLNNQSLSVVEENVNSLSSNVISFSHFILNDIDKDENYCDYSIRYY